MPWKHSEAHPSHSAEASSEQLSILQAIPEQQIEVCKSDTELLDLDPLAPLDHMYSVINKLEQQEKPVQAADRLDQDSEREFDLGGTPEISIFGKSLRLL